MVMRSLSANKHNELIEALVNSRSSIGYLSQAGLSDYLTTTSNTLGTQINTLKMIIDRKHIRTASSGNLRWLQGAIRKNHSITANSIRAASAGEASQRARSARETPPCNGCHWIEWKGPNTPQPLTNRPLSRLLGTPRRSHETPSIRLDDFNQRSDVVTTRPGHATPFEMKADSRDPLSQPQVAPLGLSLQKLREIHFQDNDTACVPALKAWMSNATPYERDVAFDVLHTVNMAGPNSRVAKDCFKSTGHRKPPSPAPRAFETDYFRPTTAGAKSKPLHLTAPHLEQRYVHKLGKQIGRAAPRTPISIHNKNYPLGQHLESAFKTSRTKDLIFKPSLFQNTKGNMKSHFTVHPEWISEDPDLRLEGPVMRTSRGAKALRYCSQKC